VNYDDYQPQRNPLSPYPSSEAAHRALSLPDLQDDRRRQIPSTGQAFAPQRGLAMVGSESVDAGKMTGKKTKNDTYPGNRISKS